MTRKMIPFVTLTVLFAFCALARPAAAQTKQVQLEAPKVNITSVTLPNTGCGVEVICVEVKWELTSKLANPHLHTFEVSGKLFYQGGASCNTNVVKPNHTARSAKVGVFQGGSCNGTVTRADVTVKLIAHDVDGQVTQTTIATKSQTF